MTAAARAPASSILDAIGDTPLLQIDGIGQTELEFLNPSGSIKARIAKYMIERAEEGSFDELV